MKALIALNGPASCGKTHFEPKLIDTLTLYGVTAKTYRITADAIWPMMEAVGVVTPGEWIDYWHFKAEHPKARQLTIDFANRTRKADRFVFLKYLWNETPFCDEPIAIFDNMGLIEEYEFFSIRVPFVSILSILLPWKHRHGIQGFPVPVGTQYPMDIRFQLPPIDGWWAMDSEHMIERTEKNLKYAALAKFHKGQAESRALEGWHRHVLGLARSEP